MSIYTLLMGYPNTNVARLKQILNLDGDRPPNLPYIPNRMYAWGFVDTCIINQQYNEAIHAMVLSRYWPTGLYKDLYVDKRKIVLITFNGGENSDEYQWVFDTLRQHPYYIKDEKDDIATSYSNVYFRIPSKHKKEAIAMDLFYK